MGHLLKAGQWKRGVKEGKAHRSIHCCARLLGLVYAAGGKKHTAESCARSKTRIRSALPVRDCVTLESSLRYVFEGCAQNRLSRACKFGGMYNAASLHHKHHFSSCGILGTLCRFHFENPSFFARALGARYMWKMLPLLLSLGKESVLEAKPPLEWYFLKSRVKKLPPLKSALGDWGFLK